jgi:hypothetical protein
VLERILAGHGNWQVASAVGPVLGTAKNAECSVVLSPDAQSCQRQIRLFRQYRTRQTGGGGGGASTSSDATFACATTTEFGLSPSCVTRSCAMTEWLLQMPGQRVLNPRAGSL